MADNTTLYCHLCGAEVERGDQVSLTGHYFHLACHVTYLTEPVYLTYSRYALDVAFDAVACPTDWRAEIDSVVTVEKVSVTIAAIQHHTATNPVVYSMPYGICRVRSVGYRAGPAGP